MKFLCIGDIHGRTNWKEAAYQVDDFDKLVFVGDLCDSFDKSDVEILHNLKEIIKFKKKYPNKVVLCHGNHDILPYYMWRGCCSGFRPSMYADLYALFRYNINLFHTIYNYKNYLFSHAGINLRWLKEIGLEGVTDLSVICDNINQMIHTGKRWKLLLDRTWMRGGIFDAGSCLWEDEEEIVEHGLIPDAIQVFGHTPQFDIKHYKQNETTGYYAIDVLATRTKFLELEI